MSRSLLVVVAIWTVLVGSAVRQSIQLSLPDLEGFAVLGYWVAAAPIAVVILSLSVQRLPGEATLGSVVDRKYGVGTYLRFLKRLRVELLSSSIAFAYGGVLLVRNLASGGQRGAWILDVFFLNVGVAFLVIHVIFRARGLYSEHGA